MTNQGKVKVIMSHPNKGRYEFESLSFDMAYNLCLDFYNKVGFIGRYYVIGSDGSSKQINS